MATNSKLTIPLKTRIALTLISTFTDRAQRSDGSINRRFLRLFDFRSPPNPKPINSVSSSDFVVDSSRDLWFRLFTPHDSSLDRIPVVVFFHGGGFAFLSPNALPYDNVCRRFARNLSAYVISVNYRLAPEHRFPAQYDDGFDVLKFLEENHATVLPSNADLSRCFLAGDSAGGNIAHHVAIRSCRAKFTAVKLIGLISIQPFFGGEERTEAENRLIAAPLVSPNRTDWCWKAMLPDGSDRNHEAANIGGANSIEITDLDYPETMVIVAGFDPLQDWQRRYYEWIKLSGKRATLIEYPNMFHAFYIFPELPESGELIHRIKDFVTERVASLAE